MPPATGQWEAAYKLNRLLHKPVRQNKSGTDVDEAGLCELDETPLAVGDEVMVQTMFGTEPARVAAFITSFDGDPHVRVHTKLGRTFTVPWRW